MVIIILLSIALACFVAAALGVGAKVNLTDIGLALWVLTVLVGAL